MINKYIFLFIINLILSDIAFSQCPNIAFIDSKTKLPLSNSSPINCSDSLDLRTFRTSFYGISGELPDGSGYSQPGFNVKLTLDPANSYLENSVEFFENGALLGKLIPTPGTNNWNITGQFMNPDAVYSFKWCDIAATGLFTYQVFDDATGFLLVSGTLDHDATGKKCFDVTIGKVNGKATFSGAGVTDYKDGTGSFNPSKAGPGIHTITYCWDNGIGCKNCSSQTIEVLGPSANAGSDKTICENENITLGGNPTATGGAGNYLYKWMPTAGLNNANIANPTASPKVSTVYILTLTDNNGKGCTYIDTVAVTVKPLPVLTLNPVVTEICKGSGIKLSASGADNYIWSPTAGLTSNIIPNPFASPTISTTYTVTGTSNGCSSINTVIVNVNSVPQLSFTIIDAKCNKADGSVISSVTQGTQPYSYKWSNNSQLSTLSGLSAGRYALTVTDSKGCFKIDTAEISNTSGPKISIINIIDETCSKSNGSATASATGGTQPYAYLWSNNDKQSTINGLSAGTYPVTVTDQSGCTVTDTAVIKNFPPPVISILNISDEKCGKANGTITVQGNGGTGIYTYLWSTNEQQSTINGLIAGQYTVTVTDGKGCSDTKTINISNIGGPSVNLVNVNDENCSQSNGSAYAEASGGTQPYTYLWSNNESQATISKISAGSYSVTVSDLNKCIAIDNVTIKNIPPPTIKLINKSDEKCGKANGSIEIKASEGTGNYSYLWSDNQKLSAISGLIAGDYIITVTDIKGCITVDTFAIINISGPAVRIINVIEDNCSKSNGSATADVSGGTKPYIYLWSNNNQQSTINKLCAGIYNVTVTDKNGCIATDTVKINNTPPPSVSIIKHDAHCSKSDGFASANVSGGTPPYSFIWSNNEKLSTVSELSSGTYIVTVSDSVCSVSESVVINDIPGPRANFIFSPEVIYVSDGKCYFSDYSVGNIKEWHWHLGNNSVSSERNPSTNFNNSGNYIITLFVTDEYGCIDSISHILKVKDLFNCYIPNAFTPGDYSLNNEFGPIGIKETPEKYDFYIFNRLGEMMFYTDNFQKKWNGIFDGSIAPLGVYVYKIIIVEKEGASHKFIGSVLLLK